MDILLINPYTRLKRDTPYFPLGLGYIAASLIEEGHNVTVLDNDKERVSTEQLIARITQINPDVICLTGIITAFRWQEDIINRIKKMDNSLPVIVGGVGVSCFPELFLKTVPADIVVKGEGDITIKRVMKYISGEIKQLSEIEGIVYRDGSDIITNPDPPYCNLDELPYPAWDLFNTERYIRAWENRGRGTSVLSSRGCAYQCKFCTPTGGHRVRFRKIDKVIDEIETLIKKYNVNLIAIADECFVINKNRVYEFCDKVMARGLNFKWHCNGRANITNDERLLKKMKAAGCIKVNYGIESGSQRILDTMDKNFKIKDAETAFRAQKRVGIPFDMSIITGCPGDDNESLDETLNFLIRNDIVRHGITRPIGLFYGTPYPSTPWFDYAIETGRIKDQMKVIRSYGENADNLVVNLSDLTDEELIKKRKYIEQQLIYWSWVKHPVKNIVEQVGKRLKQVWRKANGN